MDVNKEKENHIINSDEWVNLPLDTLYKQKNIIYDRITTCRIGGHDHIIIQLQKGLQHLDELIKLKQMDQTDKKNNTLIM